MKPIARLALLAAAAALSIGAASPKGNWLATVNISKSGSHVLGNPDAKVKLTEYVSYTCPHCATFDKEADGALKLVYVQPGKISLEISHFIRDPVDLTVAMLTNCGQPKYFFVRHSEFMATQNKWLAKLDSISEAQQDRWYNGPMPARMRAVASDFGFYKIMEKHGLSTADVNRCLADTAKAETITGQTVKASEKGVKGTPSFAINGEVLVGTHSWKALSKQLDEQF